MLEIRDNAKGIEEIISDKLKDKYWDKWFWYLIFNWKIPKNWRIYFKIFWVILKIGLLFLGNFEIFGKKSKNLQYFCILIKNISVKSFKK